MEIKEKVGRDWSATRQAEENLALRKINDRDQKLIDDLREDISMIESTLAGLNSVQMGSTDNDLMTAVRSLGAFQAVLKRKLFQAEHNG